MLIRTLPSVDSTNEEAKRQFLAGEVNDTLCVVAHKQTDGKGTQGRPWVSPEGGLYLSIVHSGVSNDIPMTTFFTLAAGVACAEALKETTNVDVQLKPINDLFVEGRKLGGILTETLIQGGTIRALITGIGINVKPVTDELAESPISLSELLPPHQFERLVLDTVVDELTEKVDQWHARVFDRQIRTVEDAWKQYQLPGTVMPLGC